MNMDKLGKEGQDLIDVVAYKCGYTTERLIDIAINFARYSDYHTDNGENYKDVTQKEWESFWKYFTELTGIECPESYYGGPFCDAPFSCSC